MERELNFTSTYYSCDGYVWGDLLDNGSYSGMVGITGEGRVDLIGTSLTLRPSRAGAVAYLHPLAFETECVITLSVGR